MRAFGSANAWLDPANTITAAKAETRNRTRRVKFMTAAHRLIAELSSGTLHAASDVAGGSGPSTRFANATPISAVDQRPGQQDALRDATGAIEGESEPSPVASETGALSRTSFATAAAAFPGPLRRIAWEGKRPASCECEGPSRLVWTAWAFHSDSPLGCIGPAASSSGGRSF